MYLPESTVGDEMERLESVAVKEQSHGPRLEPVIKENCSPAKSSTEKSSMNADKLQDASALFTNVASSEKCCSDRTEVGSPQKVLRQTSEVPLGTVGSDFVPTDSHAKSLRSSGSVPQPDARRRPISYNFAGTRHESYGNLGIASLAGLSSTSATLALLPLQASQPRTTTLPSPPVTTTTPVVTSSPPLAKTVSSSGTASLDLPSVGHGGKPVGATSHTAASVKDRRSTFFSEPPKPISLPTRSASELSSLCGEGWDYGSQPPKIVSSPSSKESNGPSLSVISVPRSASGSFNNTSVATTLETRSSPMSLHQQQRPALSAEHSQLCPDMPHAASAQRDISPMQFSDQSAASMSDSDDTNFSVWCGPPPDDTAGSEHVSTTDTCIFETGMFFIMKLFPYCFWERYLL